MLLSHWSIAPFCVDEAFSTLLGRGSPYCYPPSEGQGEVVCPNSCERPVFFCLTTSRMPRSFFGQTRGSAPTAGRIPITLPLFSDEKTPFCAPQLCFRCISNTLQRYKKILKLTNCKHKIFKNFSSARLYCHVSSSCKN